MNVTLRAGDGIELVNYPDKQPHVRVTAEERDRVTLVWPIRSPLELLQLMEIADALDGCNATKAMLRIPYLMGARSDRRMLPGDSCDLKVIAGMINTCRFRRVEIFDAHSDVATLLIHNSVSIDNGFLLDEYNDPNSVLIYPDAGSNKRIDAVLKRNPCDRISDSVQAIKKRDLRNGAVTMQVLEPEKCFDRKCVIVDDLCDGGATFNAIAEQIKPRKLTLIVSHGIFSKGFVALEDNFDEIIVSDSYQSGPFKSEITTVVPLEW